MSNESRETRRNRNFLNTTIPLYIRNRNINSTGRRQIVTNQFTEIILLFKEYNNTFRTYQSNYNSQLIEGLQNSHEIQLNYESNNGRYHENVQKIIEIIKLQQLSTTTHSSSTSSTSPSSLNENANTPLTSDTPEENNETDIWRNIFPFYIIEPNYMSSSSSTTSRSSLITVDEINQQIDYITYNEEQQIESCPISHDNFINGETICKIKNCGHIFKIQHLFNWLQINATCPVCRTELISSNDTTLLINEIMRNISI
jgi:hypothetical protein